MTSDRIDHVAETGARQQPQLPTEQGFYSNDLIYPALGWYLNASGDWWFIFATGRSENRGKNGPNESGVWVNGEQAAPVRKLVLANVEQEGEA